MIVDRPFEIAGPLAHQTSIRERHIEARGVEYSILFFPWLRSFEVRYLGEVKTGDGAARRVAMVTLPHVITWYPAEDGE